MPQYNRRELDVKAHEYGFNRDTFEKVLRLRTILEFLNTHEYMYEHLMLKGRTAINLTVFNLPRLSVDIDLDFVPNLTREETIDERERLTEILKKTIWKGLWQRNINRSYFLRIQRLLSDCRIILWRCGNVNDMRKNKWLSFG